MKGLSSSSLRSESEKEKTKVRERQRRAITGKIFHGLRKYGGYRLSPRADINEVLRHLAAEAGWTVHSDGTTFRSSSVGNCCSLCGSARPSATTTPTSSVVIAGGGGGGGGGECSTTASPRHFAGVADGDIPTSFYGPCGGGTSGGTRQFESYSGGFFGGGASPAAFQQQLQEEEEEARASNQNTPVCSPLRRGNYGSLTSD